MIYQAQIKDGGIFIPLTDSKILKRSRIRLDIIINDNLDNNDSPINATKGLLKGKIGDALEWQQQIRSEWDHE